MPYTQAFAAALLGDACSIPVDDEIFFMIVFSSILELSLII